MKTGSSYRQSSSAPVNISGKLPVVKSEPNSPVRSTQDTLIQFDFIPHIFQIRESSHLGAAQYNHSWAHSCSVSFFFFSLKVPSP